MGNRGEQRDMRTYYGIMVADLAWFRSKDK